jgi:hypothetical protein
MSLFDHTTDRPDKSARDASQTTAYELNTRANSPNTPISYHENRKIRSLLERDYAFLPLSYTSPGFLFRGLDSGLRAGISKGQFGLNANDHPLAALERELQVLLVSADFSDSLAVSRLWESVTDAGILVISADVFARSYTQHQAATLGFAEPGVVFKYPFFTHELSVDDISYFIVQRDQAEALENDLKDSPNGKALADEIQQRLIVIDDSLGPFTRHALNEYLTQRLIDKHIGKTTAVQVNRYPRRSR